MASEKIFELSPKSFFEFISAILINKQKLLKTYVFMDFLKKKALSLGILANIGTGFSKSNIDEIADKVLLSTDFNKHIHIPKINFIISEDYLIKNCEMNLIPYDLIQNEDKFLEKRAILLTDYIKSYFK